MDSDPHITRSRIALFMRAAAPATMLLLLIAVLLRFPPETSVFYPRCPIHHFFGILCPGCGTTRAFAALLHGRVYDALQLNALTTLLLPLALGYGIRSYVRFINCKPQHWPQPPSAIIYLALAITAVFSVARNI